MHMNIQTLAANAASHVGNSLREISRPEDAALDIRLYSDNLESLYVVDRKLISAYLFKSSAVSSILLLKMISGYVPSLRGLEE
jgi:hypothetical protein